MMKLAALNYLKEFCEISTFQGLNHIVAPKRHFLERVFWAVAVLSSASCAIALIVRSYRRYEHDPVVISIDKNYRQWVTVLPATTFCFDDKIDKKKAEAFTKRFPNESGIDVLHFLNCVSAGYYGTSWPNDCADFAENPKLFELDLAEVIHQVNYDYEKEHVYTHEGIGEIKLGFHRTLWEPGVCFTSNNSYLTRYFHNGPSRKNSKLSMQKSLALPNCYPSTPQCYIKMVGLPGDLKFYVHSSNDIPTLTSGVLAQRHYDITADYLKLMIEAKHELRNLRPSQRKCIFFDEKSTEETPFYTYNMCKMDCRRRLSMELCGCVGYTYMARASQRKCNVRDFPCLLKNSNLLERLLREDNKRVPCKCLPTCSSVTYYKTNVLSTLGPSANNKRVRPVTSFRFGLESVPRIKLIREIIYTKEDLLISWGGTVGLFLGCSIISLVEAFYFFTFRLAGRILHYGMAKKASGLAGKDRPVKAIVHPFVMKHTPYEVDGEILQIMRKPEEFSGRYQHLETVLRARTMDPLVMKGDLGPQYLTAIIANVLSFVYGLIIGWVAPVQPLLQANATSSNETSFWDSRVSGMSDESFSWIGGIFCIGGIVGTPLFGYLINAIGRKKSLILAGAPFILVFTLIAFATSAMYLYVARLVGGIAGGGSLCVVSVYVGEIAQDNVRGVLGSLLNLFICLGILAAYVVGSFTSYMFLALFCMFFTVLFLILVMWLPESPIYSLVNERPDEAFNTLVKLVGNHPELVQKQISILTAQVKSADSGSEVSLMEMLRDIPTRRALIIVLTIMTVQQTSGIAPILNYTVSIFETAGSSLSPSIAAIIVGTLQMFGGVIATILMDRAGRKVLLMISSVGMAITLAPIAYFLYLKNHGADPALLQSIGWLPVTALAIYVIVFAVGFGAVPFVLVAELFKNEMKGPAASICMTHLWATSFFLLKFFSTISGVLGIETCFGFFALCCTGGAAFIYFYVFETKGKSLEEILRELGGSTSASNSRASPEPFLNKYGENISLDIKDKV